MNEPNNKILIPLVAAVTLVIGILMGISLNRGDEGGLNTSSSPAAKKLMNIFEIIDKDYVDEIDKQDLLEETIAEMLHRLDPHSNYIPARELQRMTESIQGQFGGVGIRFTILRDTLFVTNVVEDAPADISGLKKFDKIIIVDGDTIAGVGLTNQKVQELLKGEAGTPVELVIERKGEQLNKKVIRGMVPINSITAAFMIDEETGYIRLSQFSMLSHKEFFNAFMQLRNEGMQKLIFDLRYNGGGVMSAAVNIADGLLPVGKTIVSTRGKNQPERIDKSQSPELFENLDLVILINQSSASASEIVAGAIQDNDRGIIVGRRSFGKGLVQQDIELIDGSNLRLTTSRYYTPTGRSIQKAYDGDYEDYMMDEYQRFEHGELYAPDSSLLVDSLKYKTPGGKVVYGGGGIMPDIFVPLDTANNSGYLRRLQYANAFSDFAFDYVRTNRLKEFNSIREFSNDFNVSEAMIQEFMRYAKSNYKISEDQRGLKKSENLIKNQLKGEIARQKWLEDGLFYVRNQLDKEVLKALEVIRSE
jgi:carboxyl-terminal processing protease